MWFPSMHYHQCKFCHYFCVSHTHSKCYFSFRYYSIIVFWEGSKGKTLLVFINLNETLILSNRWLFRKFERQTCHPSVVAKRTALVLLPALCIRCNSLPIFRKFLLYHPKLVVFANGYIELDWFDLILRKCFPKRLYTKRYIRLFIQIVGFLLS